MCGQTNKVMQLAYETRVGSLRRCTGLSEATKLTCKKKNCIRIKKRRKSEVTEISQKSQKTREVAGVETKCWIF